MPETRLVLLYEPDVRDALLIEEAFKREQFLNPGRVMRHKSELQSYLIGAGIYENRELFPLPSLLILDFLEPSISINILEWLENRGLLARFPVIGVGSRIGPRALQLAFDLGLNGYFDKKDRAESLMRMIASLQWVDGAGWKPVQGDDMQLLTKEAFSCE